MFKDSFHTLQYVRIFRADYEGQIVNVYGKNPYLF